MHKFKFRVRQLANQFCEQIASSSDLHLSVVSPLQQRGYIVEVDDTIVMASTLVELNRLYDQIMSARKLYLEQRAVFYGAMTQAERLQIFENEDPPTDEYFVLGKIIREASEIDSTGRQNYVACNWCRRSGAVCACH